MEKNTSTFRVLDTFAGAGGFSLGFEMAGYEVIGAIETDKWACDTFSYNHPHAQTIQGDITKVSDSELRTKFALNPPDVVVGGPPCQGFSIANRKSGDPKDPRNSLFVEFVRIGKIFNPKVMVMENVPNLLAAKTSEGVPVLQLIRESLEQLGYHTYAQVLHATDFGVPQIRRRLFVIASKVPLACPFPKPTHYVNNGLNVDLFEHELKSCPTLWDAISDMPLIKAREGEEVQEYSSKPNNDYQRSLRDKSEQLFNHKAMSHGKRMVERFSSMKWGDSGRDVPDHLKPRRRNSQEISVNVFDQNNRRMHPDRQCHTVPASFYANFVHPYQDRNFTAREGARIQSFPDHYRFLGKPTVVSHMLLAREDRLDEKFLCQYSQIGNAVPPLLAKAVAMNIKEQLERKEDARPRKQSRAERKPSLEVS